MRTYDRDMKRTVGWLKEENYGAELVGIVLRSGRLSASGQAIGFDPLPYRLRFSLETVADYVTSRLRVRTSGDGWSRALDLHRLDSDAWSIAATASGDAALPPAGGDASILSGALDCDLGLSPLTNTMPVLRHDMLHGGEPREFLMAWISVPDLGVHALRQRYTFLRREGDLAIVRYENADGSFTSDLVFDADGLVVHYPQLTRDLRTS